MKTGKIKTNIQYNILRKKIIIKTINLSTLHIERAKVKKSENLKCGTKRENQSLNALNIIALQTRVKHYHLKEWGLFM